MSAPVDAGQRIDAPIGAGPLGAPAGMNHAFGPPGLDQPHSMGTSIMAVSFDGGVVMGADSRTTTGSYIANRVSNKITEITPRVYVCRSGSAADTQAVSDYVRHFIGQHRIELGSEPRVLTAANLFNMLVYNNKQLSAGIIVAGWDEIDGGQVYTIPLGGGFIKQPFAIGGSGSTYVYGHVDASFKDKMSRDECIKFVTNALTLAMNRDGSSGGVIRLAIIDKNGVERRMIPGDKLPKMYEL